MQIIWSKQIAIQEVKNKQADLLKKQTHFRTEFFLKQMFFNLFKKILKKIIPFLKPL